MNGKKEYIVESLTYIGLAGEARARIEFFPTFEKALGAYEGEKNVIGNGYCDSFVRLYVRHDDCAYILRDYCPNSQSRIDTFYKGNWKGCEMVRDESEIRI